MTELSDEQRRRGREQQEKQRRSRKKSAYHYGTEHAIVSSWTDESVLSAQRVVEQYVLTDSSLANEAERCAALWEILDMLGVNFRVEGYVYNWRNKQARRR